MNSVGQGAEGMTPVEWAKEELPRLLARQRELHHEYALVTERLAAVASLLHSEGVPMPEGIRIADPTPSDNTVRLYAHK